MDDTFSERTRRTAFRKLFRNVPSVMMHDYPDTIPCAHQLEHKEEFYRKNKIAYFSGEIWDEHPAPFEYYHEPPYRIFPSSAWRTELEQRFFITNGQLRRLLSSTYSTDFIVDYVHRATEYCYTQCADIPYHYINSEDETRCFHSCLNMYQYSRIYMDWVLDKYRYYDFTHMLPEVEELGVNQNKLYTFVPTPIPKKFYGAHSDEDFSNRVPDYNYDQHEDEQEKYDIFHQISLNNGIFTLQQRANTELGLEKLREKKKKEAQEQN